MISALATTDSDFPLQLWDRLTPQVQDCINLMRASRIDPTKSAYKILNGPYNWNRYPLAPLGCKAVIYKIVIPADHGHHEGLTGGTSDHPKITTGVHCTTSLKHEHIES